MNGHEELKEMIFPSSFSVLILAITVFGYSSLPSWPAKSDLVIQGVEK